MRSLIAALVLFAVLPASAQAAPKAGSRPEANACGRGDADHPYVVGRVYHGEVTWPGSATESLTITFNADCTTRYAYDDGSKGVATWEQDGELLVLDVNHGYASYIGAIAGDDWSGKLLNREGKAGSFVFRRRS